MTADTKAMTELEKLAKELSYKHLDGLMEKAEGDQETKGWFADYKVESAFVAGFNAALSHLEQDRARVALAELARIGSKQMFEKKIKDLEARLQESERLRADYEHECETIKEMKDKLAQALASRDAYANAMATVMREGIFANKELLKRELEKILEGHQ